ncbi:monofunctional biosynthetic peptidoglycan transglycosylase [Marinobacter zhanjiangensis]|uniref:monofunctional biosynthetic peptidoglycan transglycosylase n=1 Tax=Marinobacter zhanjiangensis TaxID=578215 RepID=UPI001D12EE67|nr:monofunctional biosynthetic peptidoglycan transglycosylase [Marinobacter zhanjiangensis]
MVRITLRWLFLLVLLGLGLTLVVLLLFRFVNPPTTAFILGYQVESGSLSGVRNNWVPLDEISPWMPLAVIASEDQRFLTHWGLDTNAIATAVNEFRGGEGLRGASTITQQTAKNLFLWGGRSYVRKGVEAALAVAMDGLWPKRRIMEVYLNVAEFGPGLYGVEAASQVHFGVPADQLTATQAARLAAVLPNPKVFDAGNPSPYVRERVSWIRRQMDQLGGTRLVGNFY